MLLLSGIDLYASEMHALYEFWRSVATSPHLHNTARLAARLTVTRGDPVDLEQELPAFIAAIAACRQAQREPNDDPVVRALYQVWYWTFWSDTMERCERRLRRALADRANTPYREPLIQALHLVSTYRGTLDAEFSARDARAALEIWLKTDDAIDAALDARWQAAEAAMQVYDDPLARDVSGRTPVDLPADKWDSRPLIVQVLDFDGR